MKKITSWLMDGMGCIRGFAINPQGLERSIRTSPVVSRDGHVVTTRSGSRYELIDPPHWCMTDARNVQLNFGGNTDPLKAIDYRIANHD